LKGMYPSMLSAIDALLDRVTMYRLLLYYLIGLLIAAVGLSIFGDLHYNPLLIAMSALILVTGCWIANKVFAIVFDAPTNVESTHITALILALIITPANSLNGVMFLLAAAGLATASKYILAIKSKHIFNPAAIAVVLTAIGPKQTASWWVGSAVMLPFVLIGGILLVRKIQRGRTVITFFISVILATCFYTLLAKGNIVTNLDKTLLSSAVCFLAFVMLTEPLTSPPTKAKRTWYAVLIGALFPPQVHILSVYSSPELALIIGNIYAYVVSPKAKLFLRLKQKIRLTPDSVDFVYTPDRQLSYRPGQYMEWTLAHNGVDSRGNRRYFTLASSPTEADIHLGVKFYEKGSSYKRALLTMDNQTTIVASQIAGDFVLPNDPNQKIVFIAGGIGVTPFRSMIKYLIDTNQKRIVTLLYSAKTQQDLAYRQIFEEARQKLGIKTIYNLTDSAPNPSGLYEKPGIITAELIKTEVPDYQERVFYISGTHAMVVAMRTILQSLGVAHHNIKEDFFPGYA